MTKTYRITGMNGHRMRYSFSPSRSFDWSDCPYARPVQMHVSCSDETGTNDYIDVTITAPDESMIIHELWGQLSDGLFEDCRWGKVLDAETGEDAPCPYN